MSIPFARFRTGTYHQPSQTPYQAIQGYLTASGCTTITDSKLAVYLDEIDKCKEIRQCYNIPSNGEMNTVEREKNPVTRDPYSQVPQHVLDVLNSLKPKTSSRDSETNGSEGVVGKVSGAAADRSSLNTTRPEVPEEDGGYASDASTLEHQRINPAKFYTDLPAYDPPRRQSSIQASEEEDQEYDFLKGRRPDPPQQVVYMAGNSLGLPCRASLMLIQEEMQVWSEKGVSGWFSHHYKRPWKSAAERISPMLASVVGCNPTEVVTMGTLTANLHLLLCSFYRPTSDRYKILYEAKAFPSDNYAFQSQVAMHGYDPKDALIKVAPRGGQYLIDEEDILKAIEQEGDKIAVVIFSGINYFTGQFFDMKKITEKAQAKGCVVGWDLAHAIGNVELKLHDWNVDFAVWCTYKYLNSGPGGIGGLYVHEKHSERPRLAGWWGNDLKTRFKMAEDFDPAPGAHGFQTSTPSIFNLVSLQGALETWRLLGHDDKGHTTVDATVGIAFSKLRAKSKLLTAYLMTLLKSSKYYVPPDKIREYEERTNWRNGSGRKERPGFTIITPEDPNRRGAQLSVLLLPREVGLLQPVNDILQACGVFGDEREPDVMRFAPVPSYNSFRDCWLVYNIFPWALKRAAMRLQSRDNTQPDANGQKTQHAAGVDGPGQTVKVD